MLRRYWWPVAFTEKVTAQGAPVPVRVLGEDLVVYRDGQGNVGLVATHCSHRGTTLEYGRVEECGIRCPYHGWLYHHTGRCLDQPAEPEDSTYRERIKHPAYKTEELSGLIFAYMGPDPAPLLPRWDILVMNDGKKVVAAKTDHCNWLQPAENTVDQSHLPYLHASLMGKWAFKQPHIEWERTPYGIRAHTSFDGQDVARQSDCIFPSLNRIIGFGTAHAFRWRVPRDDENVNHFWMNYEASDEPGLQTIGWQPNEAYVYAMQDDEYWHVRDQDRMAVETQGRIYNRSNEHLGTSDKGVIMLRQMIKESIEAVQEGHDPYGLIRDIELNDCIVFGTQAETTSGVVAAV